jgi:hypothetical protein
MDDRQLAASYRIAHKRHARSWNEAFTDFRSIGHPRPCLAAYEATAASRQEVEDLAAEIELRTGDRPLMYPSDQRVEDLTLKGVR